MSETTTTEDTTIEDTEIDTEAQKPEGTEDLGDAGKKALTTTRGERNAARKEASDLRAELATLKAAAANKDKPAEEQALEAARAEARTEANNASNARLVKVELRAAAKGKLADPTDAHLYINLADFDVNDDGEVDSAALDDAIDELLTRKPHLAVVDPRKFAGSADQGAKSAGDRLTQLNDADIENMSPADVNKARREGRLNKMLGIL